MSILLRRRELTACCPVEPSPVIYDAKNGIGLDSFQVAGSWFSGGSSKYTFKPLDSTNNAMSLFLEVFDGAGTNPSGAVSIRTKNPVDFTNYTKMRILVKKTELTTTAAEKNGVRFQAGIGACSSAYKNSYALYRDIYLLSGSKHYQIDYKCTSYISAGAILGMDVSKLTSGYPCIGLYAYRSVTGGYWVRHKILISKIWLE